MAWPRGEHAAPRLGALSGDIGWKNRSSAFREQRFEPAGGAPLTRSGWYRLLFTAASVGATKCGTGRVSADPAPTEAANRGGDGANPPLTVATPGGGQLFCGEVFAEAKRLRPATRVVVLSVYPRTLRRSACRLRSNISFGSPIRWAGLWRWSGKRI